MSKFCRSCGATWESGTTFCTACGARSESVESDTHPTVRRAAAPPEVPTETTKRSTTEQSKPSPAAIGLGIAAALMVVAVGVVGYLLTRPAADPLPQAEGVASATESTAVPPAPTEAESTESPTAKANLSGSWQGSMHSDVTQSSYGLELNLVEESADLYTGTLRVTNRKTENSGAWNVTGTVSGDQVLIDYGTWIDKPDDEWTRDTLDLVWDGSRSMDGWFLTEEEPGTRRGPAYVLRYE